MLVYGARPQLAGRGVYVTTRFVLLGVATGLSNTDITGLYLSKYRIPSAGFQIALRMAPVSATGFRRARTLVTGMVMPVAGLELG